VLGANPTGRVAAAAAGAAVALGTFRLAGDAPKPLLLTLALTFAVVALGALALRRGPGPALLLLLWTGLSAAFLGALHRADRAGWNWYRATGFDVAIDEDLRDRVGLGAAELVRRDPRFAADPRRPGGIVLRRGVHDVAETIVIPAGVTLAIEPGTVLRFGAGRSLVAYGPVEARGTEAEPIVFTARHPWLKWGVVAVVGGGRSRFEHVRVEHARWARVNGLDLPGALSFLESDVELSRSEIAHAFGKDALYVRGGRVVARANLFRDAVRDGLDVDGGSGLVEGNRFLDCGDEAMDLSGRYRIEVVGNEFLDSDGGRVAAGADLDAIRSRNTFGRPDDGARQG
jgi:hypothetical protein